MIDDLRPVPGLVAGVARATCRLATARRAYSARWHASALAAVLWAILSSNVITVTGDSAHLDSHCSRFHAYERGIAEDLLPWYDDAGISEELMDRTLATRTMRAGVAGLPLCIRNGSLYVIDGREQSLTKPWEWQAHNIVVYAAALARLVARWGAALPDVEFVVETTDTSFQDRGTAIEGAAGQAGEGEGGVWGEPHSRLPVMRHCRAESGLDITVPIFHFYEMPYDERFLENGSRWTAEHPWETRRQGAFAAGTTYHRHQAVPATTKSWDGRHGGEKVEHVRAEFAHYLAEELRHPSIAYSIGGVPIAEWAQYRMVMHVDGITCSSRLQQLLALGSVVLREMSGYQSFYDKLLQRFVHYVPFWSYRPREVVWAYNWVASNQEAAARIAANGAAFAREYLNRQAIECYWIMLWRQYARLQRFTPGQRGGGPGAWQGQARSLDLMPIDEWLASQEGKIANWGPSGIADKVRGLHLLPLR